MSEQNICASETGKENDLSQFLRTVNLPLHFYSSQVPKPIHPSTCMQHSVVIVIVIDLNIGILRLYRRHLDTDAKVDGKR